MQRALVVVASLVMSLVVESAVAGMAPPSPAAKAPADPATGSAPLERLLIAVVGAGADPSPVPARSAAPAASAAPAGDDPLEAPVRLADPTAAVVVLRPGDPDRTVGPFTVHLGPATGAGAPALVVETAGSAPTSIDLPDTVDGHVTVVEVLGGPGGIVAHRIGDLQPVAGALRVPTWSLPGPGTDVVALDDSWWTLAPDVVAPETSLSAVAAQQLRRRLARTPVSRLRRLVDASVGDVTGDGTPDLALSFRRPFRRTLLNASTPRRDWVDARGLSAHLGLFRPDDLSSIWVAGTLVRPIRRLAACSGALAVAYSTLHRPDIVATTAQVWQGFGFLPLPELPGAGRPTCIDLDRDGRPDAAIVERS